MLKRAIWGSGYLLRRRRFVEGKDPGSSTRSELTLGRRRRAGTQQNEGSGGQKVAHADAERIGFPTSWQRDAPPLGHHLTHQRFYFVCLRFQPRTAARSAAPSQGLLRLATLMRTL